MREARRGGRFLLYGAPARWLGAAVCAARAILSRHFCFLHLCWAGCRARRTQFFPVAASPTDFYHQKTDAELLFLVEHPDYYQPDLVDEARRELRRRGVDLRRPAPPEPLFAPAPAPAPAGLSTGLLALLVGAGLALCLGGLLLFRAKNQPPPPPAAPRTVHKGPVHLVEAPMSVMPDFGPAVESSVLRQVQRVPVAERFSTAKAEMPMRQYRGLAKRFWTAETQTEYLLDQARQGHRDAALAGHVQQARASWQQWNNATVYSYELGPTMTSHLRIMTRVARQQQWALDDLLRGVTNPSAHDADQPDPRAAEVSSLLAGLLPRSPVTGQPYRAVVRREQ
jgi:hypothetical protein